MRLHDAVIRAAARTPDALAVKGPDRDLTYSELDALANRIARVLSKRGIVRADVVALLLDKSALTVAAMQAVLRLGAAYVPVDPGNPPARAASILSECGVRLVITTSAGAAALAAEGTVPPCLCVDGSEWAEVLALEASPVPDVPVGGNDLAYILCTSGSTGKPKGVRISHDNVLAFVHWAVAELGIAPADRLANHAPFHFDLSVLDLYAAFAVGASVVLIPEELAYAPARLVQLLRRERLTVWYSVPSALLLMMDHGGLLDAGPGPLRAVLFAGEVFPIKPLRRLRESWPGVRLLNLYGPTETNVCTFYEVAELAPDCLTPVPIGRACCGDTVWARTEDGRVAGPGEEGELIVSGPTVMQGYCGQEPQNGRPYATGDIVRVRADGNFEYIGRRDRMVKVRGRRIEPGEIETVLQEHPAVRAAAVIVSGVGLEARLVAFLVCPPEQRPSLLEIKAHCARRLPPYMVVDAVRLVSELPRGRTGKVDRGKLQRLLAERDT